MRYFEMKSSRETGTHLWSALHSTWDMCSENMADLLYPPHMRRLPVKADLPCSTRQLSKTVIHVRSVCCRFVLAKPDGRDGPGLTQHLARLQLEPVLVLRVADEGVEFSRTFFVSEGAPQSDSELDTHAAASYQRSMSGPIFVLTPARSAVFQRTCLR
jgi:hypothetical protein